ncbi:caspase recruitment domain-containing protein 6 [Rhynchocyon petersi]
MATDPVPSEIIERERKKVLEILQQDPESVLDTLTSRRLISEEEYESLETITDPLKKSRKLLILVQKKGEVGCLHFLKCLVNTFPDSVTVWDLNIRQDLLKHETIEQSQSTGRSKISEDDFSSCNKQSENAEIMPSFEEKGQLDLRTSEFLGDKNISDRETASSSKGKGHDTPTHTFSYAVEDGECEVPFTIAYLRDGQRYEEPDDSLYLGKEEYLELIGYVEDAETTLEKDHDDPEHVVQGGEEDPVYAEVTEFSDDAQSYEESETGVLLEEEEEEDEEKKKQVFKDILSCLNMNRSRKLLPDSVKQFSLDRGSVWVPETPGDLVWDFLVKVQAQDVTARDSVLKPRVPSKEEELLTEMEHLQLGDIHTINHLDVLCAAMLCSDSSLQSEIMSNMHHCQFALPLLLPDAENNRSILMLGAMKRIVEKQSAQSSESPAKATENLLTHIKTPVISFVRLQSCSVSKSRILNTLLSPTHTKLHEIFLHRDSSAFQLPRQISDGLVEITWCFPDGEGLKENRSCFQKPVAVTNLRGDLECFWIQFGFLMEVSSAVFVFTDFLGEKEWNLLRFLEEAALEKCYFVLSSQAKESEEAHVFQRILKLKSSQLLFLEGEGAGDTGKGLECLQAVLQEVVCSSFRFMSVEDMASLARELGIQVDQDCENSPGIQGSTGENMAGAVEGQQRHNQPKSPEQMPTREPGYLCGVSQNPQNVCSPVSVPPPRISSPFPPRIRGNFNQASLKPPWVMGSHFWSEQRYRWFRPLTFHNRRAHHRGKHFGPSYFQPQRFYSDERIMNFSRISQGSPWNVRCGMQPRPAPQHAQAWAERPKPVGMFGKSGTGTSQGGHLHSTGSQPAGTFGKSQHRVVCAQGTQLATATGKLGSTASHIKDPPHQASHPEGDYKKQQNEF